MDRTTPVATAALEPIAWLDYHDHYTSRPDHRISGIVRVAPQLPSPQLGNRRDLLVYLPPSYHRTTRRYPVIYMHDGQNLFDHATSYAGEWGVDETMEMLAHTEGLEAIIVVIPTAGPQRLAEYTPFHDGRLGGGRGDDYLAFIVDTVKPLIDGNFRTLPNRRYTGIMGSSLGGLISLYAFFQRPTAVSYTHLDVYKRQAQVVGAEAGGDAHVAQRELGHERVVGLVLSAALEVVAQFGHDALTEGALVVFGEGLVQATVVGRPARQYVAQQRHHLRPQLGEQSAYAFRLHALSLIHI